MQRRLVSILTPMYNTEKYVHRLLDSVLSQDYPCIEMIVVDDGSTDGSARVVEGYAGRFSEKGYALRYVHQPNSGQSVALKNGLGLVTGEYLTWPDSDDFYSSDTAISKMVDVLESADEAFQMVRTHVRYVRDYTLELLRTEGAGTREEEDPSLFEDCLFDSNGFFYCAGSYMVRTAVLKELTGFDIYTEKNAGQNWQLLLPVLYAYRCKTIPEPLFTVVERDSSHSRGQYSGYQRAQVRKKAYLDTRKETLKRIEQMPEESLAHYLTKLDEHYERDLFELAVKWNDRQTALDKIPHCKAGMEKGEYRTKNFFLHLPGGTRLLNAYKDLHHRLHLLKQSLKKSTRTS